MRKLKKMSNKLIAILLSASMIFAPVIQSMPVYAAEPVIEEGSAGTLTDNAATDEPADDNNDSDTPAADNGDSDNQGTDTGNPENPGTENGDTENPGTDNGDNGNTGNENGDSENSGTENGDAENPGTEDGDTENPENPDAEDEDPEDLGDAEADESLNEGQDEAVNAVSAKAATVRGTRAVNVSGFENVGGWNESIYAEIAGIEPVDVVEVSYSGAMSGSLSKNKVHESPNETDLDYLVRKVNGNVRIDIPGLKEGTYNLTVKLGNNGQELKKEGIKVYEYDRSGYAHFNYSDGVGAYKDDGTLKDNAIVLYVNKDTVNTVTLKVGNTTVKGIGNILNSVGKECGEAGHEGQCKRTSGKKSYYAAANTNQNVITKLSEANIPLVVRFIGAVSDSGLDGKQGSFNAASTPKIDGLTIYNKYDNGGSPGDNGHMARIQSGKNITLEGIGYDATIDGWGFHFMAETSTTAKGFGKSFEVRNLKFVNTPEDAIGMEGQQDGDKISAGVERCWVHNNEFYCPEIGSPAESDKSEGDGSVDFKRGMYFTCSYNYFDSCHKTNLVGSSDSSLQFNLTYHHNYWYMCKARGPLTRKANVHMYNNIFDMQTDYAMNTRANAYIFSESNIFYACKSPHAVEAGAIKSWNDSITSVLWNKGSTGTYVKDRNETVSNSCAYNGTSYSSFDTDSSLFYYGDYALQENFEEMRKVIVSQTGTQEQKPVLAAAVDKKAYSVVERMAKATNADIEEINVSTPQTLTPGKLSKTVYAFEVNTAFDLEVEYDAGSKAIPGVLVNEEGVNLLEGNGSRQDIPAGKYMIQALTFQPGDPKKGTIAVFKEFSITSLKISAHDSTAHVHKYELKNTIEPTCTEAGKNVYECKADSAAEGRKPCNLTEKEETIPALGHDFKLVEGSGGKEPTCEEDGTGSFKCSRCPATENGTVPKLGHKWGEWTITPATATTAGKKERVCARDASHKETEIIPATGGGSTVAGDYVLTFTGKKINDDAGFFTLSNYNFATNSTGVTINGTEYKDNLKIESKTTISFTCNEGATLTMIFSDSGKKVKVNGTQYTTDANGEITIEDLAAKTYTITKGDTTNLYYMAVKNKGSAAAYYTVSLEYNYDDAPDAMEVPILAGTYNNLSDIVPSSFMRTGYELTGLYTDALCTQPIPMPYTVSANVRLYADWEDETSDEIVETVYSLTFESNGGSSVATAQVSTAQIYKITESSTRAGYAFAGWYTAREGGNPVDAIDGSALEGDVTLYAHWNPMNTSAKLLDCSKDLGNAGRDITSQEEINGFKIHAASGDNGASDPLKYYMTFKKDESGLYTNGLLLTDTNIPGNGDGLLKSIEFDAPASSVLTVEVGSSASKGKTTCLVLAQKNTDGSLTEVGRSEPIVGKTKTTKTFDIDNAGTYYLYPATNGDKGVVYYRLEVTVPQYTIVYRPGIAADGGNFADVVKNEGETITLPGYTAAAGYEFGGWSLDGTNKYNEATYTVDPLDASDDNVITFTALYSAKEYTVKYEKGDGTLPENLTETVKAHAGDSLTPGNCTPPDDFRFVGWQIGESAPFNTYLVKADDADENDMITIKAVYVQKPVSYTLHYDVNDGKLPDGVANDVSVVEGEIKNLPDCVAPTGKQFVGWTKKGITGYVKSYTVKADDADENNTITFTAEYVDENEKYYTVRLDPKGGTLPDGVERISQVRENETINPGKCTPPSEDQRFIGWTVSNQRVKLPYKVTEDVVLVAQYGDASDYEGIYIIGLEPEYEYTGAKIIPNIGIMDYNVDDGKLLTPGVDYTVKYKNNVKVADITTTPEKKRPTVTVTGRGNYANMKIERNFIIKEVTGAENLADLKGAKIDAIAPMPYTGDAQYPAISLKLKTQTKAVEYTYRSDGKYRDSNDVEIPANVAVSNNINKGTATILLTGEKPQGKTKATTLKKTFKITAIDLKANESKITVEGLTDAVPYAVKGAVPKSITVKLNGETLRNGTDYTVKYSSNKKVGTPAKVTITGKGNYTKKITKTYNLAKLDMSSLKVNAVKAYDGLKASKVTATVLDKDGNTLKPSQYTLVVKNEAGQELKDKLDKTETPKILVSAVAKDTINLEGSTPATGDDAKFAVGINIAGAKFVLKKDSKGKAISKQYTGEEIEISAEDFEAPTIKVKGQKEPKKLTSADYYIDSYMNNINKGTATAIIVGKDEYSGTKMVKFKIVGQEVDSNSVTGLDWDDIQYDIKSFFGRLFR